MSQKIEEVCPACRESGSDKSGNHLLRNEDGSWGCVLFPATHPDCKSHRLRCIQLRPELGREPIKTVKPPLGRLTNTYIYRDEVGTPVYEVRRYFPKDFRQYRHHGGKPVAGMQGVKRVPFRLPEVMKAKTVWIAEGEKDVDNLVAAGVTATCNAGGAEKWGKGWGHYFKDKDVILCGDNDEPGRRHMDDVEKSLKPFAKFIRRVLVPAPCKDVSDVLEGLSGLEARAEIEKLLATAKDANHSTEKECQIPGLADVSPLDELGLENDLLRARAFVKWLNGTARYCPEKGLWLVFEKGKGWTTDVSGQLIRSLAQKFVEELLIAAVKSRENEKIKRLTDLGENRSMNSFIDQAKDMDSIVIHQHQLDADPLLVGCENGIICLETGTLHPFSIDCFVTKRLAAKFDPNAQAPLWESFLKTVIPDPDIRAFKQRWFGYCLTGYTREHKLPFLYGSGANGKSTMLEPLCKMYGDYAHRGSNQLFYAQQHGRPPELEIACLAGARLILGQENTTTSRLNEEVIKGMVSGDKQRGRFHHQNFFDYQPTFKIVLFGNHKPKIHGTDEGIWRRFMLVNFGVTIPDNQRDPELSEKLWMERDGILLWCVKGCLEYLQRRSLEAPESILKATQEFRVDLDVIADFIEACTENCPGNRVTKHEAYKCYREWCERTGSYQLKQKDFGNQLTERGWVEVRTSKVRSWADRSLKFESEE